MIFCGGWGWEAILFSKDSGRNIFFCWGGGGGNLIVFFSLVMAHKCHFYI